jgi:hypothetical protein
MFQMHRIFCATPWELEAERSRFHEILGCFNEERAMAKGILLVPVSLMNIRDKRPVQYAVDDNIRECRHYVLLLQDDWGPVERNFENDYHLALECASDPSLPMRGISLVRKIPPSGRALAPGIPEPHAVFSTPSEFEQCVRAVLAKTLTDERHATA